jgi:hypothetical protein
MISGTRPEGRLVRRSLALLVLALGTACGSSGPATLSTPPAVFPSDAAIPTYTPTPPPASPVHFDTPEQAMTYLAAAWNRGDLTALKHVTDPAARERLLEMHTEATNLKLHHCTFTKERGDYECYFTHDFPKGYKSETGHGTAEFTVGPATRHGWYMTYFVDCGG